MDQLYIVQQNAICSTLIRKEFYLFIDIVVTALEVLTVSVERKTSVVV